MISGNGSISGSLVIDISSINVVDGMTITLISGNFTGKWDSVTLQGTTTDCILYNVDVTYASNQALATLSQVDVCYSFKIYFFYFILFF